jgi:hypothetical protein
VEKITQILKSKSPDVLKSSLFIKTFLATLIPYPSDGIIREDEVNKAELNKIYASIDYSKIEGINDMLQLNDFILEFYENLCDRAHYRKALCALTITDKGLTTAEISQLTNLTHPEFICLVAVFRTFMMKYKNLWKINNETFKKAITTKYLGEFTLQEFHFEIAMSLNVSPNSIRKIEEQTYHLFMSKKYFKLKEAVSNMENFLLLFNPNTKYDLFRYW